MFREYLLREHKTKISNILLSNDTATHYSINIPFVHFFEADHSLATLLLQSPDEAIKLIDKEVSAVQDEIQTELCNSELDVDRLQLLTENSQTFKGLIHFRIYDLYFSSELNLYVFPRVAETSYLQISGTVTRIAAVKLLKYKRDYSCKKCREVVTVTADYERKYRILAPQRCPNENCNGVQMIEADEIKPTYCKDYQEIKLQEDLTLLGSGIVPHSMWATLEDDLADICKPGDSVTICGVVKSRRGPLIKNKRIDTSLVLQAHHVAINNIAEVIAGVAARSAPNHTDFEHFWNAWREKGATLRGRDVVLRSFSPEIHGMYMVKLAVAAVLAGGGGGGGGSGDGNRTRLHPHLLLVGDPGTGKSQLLRYASRVITRSVCTTGIGSTSAGLTVTTIMEDGEWQLEAGALVLADGGICCIDEFHTMREHDRTSIHEAMEQQSISVAKANIVCKLNTRCSILATANPQGPFDASQTLSCNVALASPLLSRFDLILTLKDVVDSERDARVADFVLRGYQTQQGDSPSEEVWNLDTLKEYYVEIRKRRACLTPKVTPILNAYYQYRRRRKFRNEARTTVRLLDSLVRLTKAHAKLMFRDEVSVVDAVMAIALLEASVEMDSPDLGGMFDPQMDFPADPEEWYRRVERFVFDKLQIEAPDDDVYDCTTRLNASIEEHTKIGGEELADSQEMEKSPSAADMDIPEGEICDNVTRVSSGDIEERNSQDFERLEPSTVLLPQTLQRPNALTKVDDVRMDVLPCTSNKATATEKQPSVDGNGQKRTLKQRFGFIARDGDVLANDIIQPETAARMSPADCAASARNLNPQNDFMNIFSEFGQLDDDDLDF